jgi:hypothetical protein
MISILMRFIRSRNLTICFLLIILTGFLASNCAPTKYELGNKELGHKNLEELKGLWLKSNSLSTRIEVVQELESRKATDALTLCLSYAKNSLMGPKRRPDRARTDVYKFKLKEFLIIVKALGRLKDPGALASLADIGLHVPNKKLKLAVLQAYKEIDNPKAVLLTTGFLTDTDYEVRWQALDTLSHFKGPDSMEAIFPLVYDNEPDIRFKAIHALGEIGNPKAIDHVSLLLADRDESVKGLAETVLRELGARDESIKDWKEKAEHLSLEDVYRSKIAYQRAVVEKEALKKKLESEADIKRQLEESFKEHELAYNKQQKLIASLYEEERQLKSKVFQLEEARKKSEEYRKKLEDLEHRAEEINRELSQTKDKPKASDKKELDRILQEKSKFQIEAESLRAKELRLSEEVSVLKGRSKQAYIEAERAKGGLAAMRKREMELSSQIDELKKRLNRAMAPVLVVSKPRSGSKIESSTTMLHIIAVDDRGIRDINVSLNGKPVRLDIKRGIKVATKGDRISKKVDITQRLQLEYGQNTIIVSVRDTDGMTAEEEIAVTREKGLGKIWAIVIGINQYQNTRNLKYAVNDARAFRDYLKQHIGIPDEHIFSLIDDSATKAEIQSLLGTKIKRKAGIDDTVIIFYAGHGAVETDPLDPDDDGFEKYLLPHDANLDDLYSTAIAMEEIKKIFRRISAERLIFIADTCYSGASGGRTMLASKTRATLSEKFFERISKGKGRVIISACSANEISKEDDSLRHGVFSYFVLKGLKGEADFDGDGIITVSELFGFLSKKVPEASGQDQHPVRKGETEGELVLGRVK